MKPAATDLFFLLLLLLFLVLSKIFSEDNRHICSRLILILATKPGRRGLYVRGLVTNVKQILYFRTFYHTAGVKPAATDFIFLLLLLLFLLLLKIFS